MYAPTGNWYYQPAQVGGEAVHYKTADGLELTSWYRAPKSGKPTLIMYHGNGGNVSYRAGVMQYFGDLGYGVMLVGYRGYGGNKGAPSEEGLYADARAALRFLRDVQAIPSSQVFIYGQSIGTAVAVQMALEYKDARGLILEAPPASVATVAGEHYKWVAPAAYYIVDQFDSLSKMPDIEMPLLVVQGTDDQIVHLRNGIKLFHAGRMKDKKMVIVKDATHFNLFNNGLKETMARFMAARS